MARPKMRHTCPRGTSTWIGPYHGKQDLIEARAKVHRKKKKKEIQNLLGRADVTEDDRAVLRTALDDIKFGRKLSAWQYEVLRKYKNKSTGPKKKKKVIIGICSQ